MAQKSFFFSYFFFSKLCLFLLVGSLSFPLTSFEIEKLLEWLRPLGGLWSIRKLILMYKTIRPYYCVMWSSFTLSTSLAHWHLSCSNMIGLIANQNPTPITKTRKKGWQGWWLFLQRFWDLLRGLNFLGWMAIYGCFLGLDFFYTSLWTYTTNAFAR